MRAQGTLLRGLRLLGRAIREQPGPFTLAVAGSCGFSLLTIASAYVSGQVIGRVAVPDIARGRVAAGALAVAAVVIFAVSLGRATSLYLRRIGAGTMQYRLQAEYRRRVTRRYLDLPLSWHARHATGTLLSNANADVEAAWSPIAPLPFAVGTTVMLAASVVALLLTDWVLALVGLAVLPGLLVINVFYSRRMSPRMIRAQQLRAEVSAVAHESFDGALVIKAMGREAQETERFAQRANELRDAMIRVGRVRGMFDPILDALPSLGTLAVLVAGGLRLAAGAVSIAEVLSVAFLFSVLAVPVRSIGFLLADLPRCVAGWDRVQRVLVATGDMTYGQSTVDGTGPAGLRLEHVDFAYPDDTRVLHDVSVEVPPGRTVALVGPTGAGKSTLAALAVRLVDPDAGAVRLDGVDLCELSAAALAGAIALVPQVPFVFDDSLHGNVDLDRAGVDGESVAAALGLAQASGFVTALPDGPDTMVGERGTSLSGGQRQRLTLARALAGRPRLLVLDDATSAVDPRVEARILRALRERGSGAGGGASILVVAYRRATIALADEVVYLDRGRVLARGRHEDLLATVPGYAALVTAYEAAERDREVPLDPDLATDADLLDADAESLREATV